MTPELAQLLKDAGFPQTRRWGRVFYDLVTKTQVICTKYTESDLEEDESIMQRWLAMPEFEEIVSECIKDWRGIEAIIHEHSQGGKDTWVATSFHGRTFHGEGDTPTEAVSELYIALQSKV